MARLRDGWDAELNRSAKDLAREAILKATGCLVDPLLMDGEFHRFKTNEDTGAKKTGWYILHDDGIPAGAFGDFRREIDQTWCAPWIKDQDSAELREIFRKAAEERNKERRRQYDEAARTALEIWKGLDTADAGHPYFQKKGVKNYGLRQTGDGRLVMPVYVGENSKLSSLQYISADGRKQFMSGGEVSGGYFVLEGEEGAKRILYIVEGYATGASVREATGCPVCVALNAGNLKKAAKIAREQTPIDVPIVIVGDNDESGVGQEAAKKAAEDIGADVIIPPETGDANDYAQSGKDLRALLMPARTKRWIRAFKDFRTQPEPIKWLIKGWIQAEATMMIFGQPGAGKSFMALDMACSIATPGVETWHELPLKHGPVVYLAGEGYLGLKQRVVGWAANKKVEDMEFYLSEEARDLNTPNGLSETIQEIQEQGVQPVLIVVDTLHRFMTGDENKAMDAKTMLDACAELARIFHCAVLLVHHTGVNPDAQDRARGSSAWRGAMDIEMSVKGDGATHVSIAQTKNKDAERQAMLDFEMVTIPVPGWFDEDGEQVTTKVLELGLGEELEEKPLTQKQHEAIQIYTIAAEKYGLLGKDGKFRGLRKEDWRREYYAQNSHKPEGTKRQAFTRVQKELVSLGWLAYDKTEDIYIPVHEIWAPWECQHLSEELRTHALHALH